MFDAAHQRVTIVTVSFNSLGVLPGMLASVPEGTPVVIVENGPGPHEEIAALARSRGARLIVNPRNMGFGPACNLGADGATTEFLLFLNPDTRLGDGALAELVAAADRHAGAAAFNPALTDGRGRPAFKRRSVLLPRSDWMARTPPARSTEVPVLSGAAFFVRRAAFEAVGGFDPGIFLYHEDDDLALRLRAACGALMVVPGAMVRHEEGRSAPRSPAIAALKARHMGYSRVYATRKHGLPFAATRAVLGALAGVVSPLTLLSARKRAKNIAYLKGVIAGAAAPRPPR